MLRYFFLMFCLLQVYQCAPLKTKMVDLTYVFDNSTLYYPTVKKFEMNVTFNGTYNNSFWFQLEDYSATTHVGTHMDAPCHFIKNRWTVDEIPLSRLVAPAAVIDITQKAEADRDYEVTVDDLLEWESQTKQALNECILLIRSGWGKKWHSRELYTGTNETYSPDQGVVTEPVLHFPGIHPNAAQWLVDNRNIYGAGIDTLSIDHGPSTEYRTHRILFDKNIFSLENVANMEELPLYGAMLYVMPMKIGKASGAPLRMFATFTDVIFGGRHAHTVTERSLREVIIFT